MHRHLPTRCSHLLKKSAIQGDSMTMMDMSSHDQAAMSHDMMQNSNSAAHQDMAEMHKKNDES